MTWRRNSTSTDTLSLTTVKEYLKVNYNDEDEIINTLIDASLQMTSNIVQKAIFNTDYVDYYPNTGTVPQNIWVLQTDPPTAQPLVYYTNTSSIRTQYPAADIDYNYIEVERSIHIELTGAYPEVEEGSLIEVDWSVAGNSTDLVNNARIRLIAGWYEGREALTGNYTWVNGVEALLSPVSLVM